MTDNLHRIRTASLLALVIVCAAVPAARADFVDAASASAPPAPSGFGAFDPFAPGPELVRPDWTAGGWGDPLEHHINPSPSAGREQRVAQVPPLGIGHLPDPDPEPVFGTPDLPRLAWPHGPGAVPAPGAIVLLLLGRGGRRRR